MAFTIHGEMARGADGLTTIMNRHQTVMGKSIEKISTGLKINHAGDDAAGNAISERMQTQIRALDQSQENTQSAGALLGVAEASITSMLDVVTEMRTKAVTALSTSDDEERSILNYEINQLKDEIIGQSMVTQNGRHLFDGRFGKVQETLEEATTYIIGEYNQNGDSLNQKLGFSDLDWVGNEDDRMYFQVGPENGDVVTVHLMNMTKIFDGLTVDLTTEENAAKTMQSMDNLINRMTFQLTEIASVQERLEFTSENLQMVTDDTRAALDTIQDTDMAKEMTKFVKHNVLMQATQSMMAQANTTLASFVDLLRPVR